MSRSQSPSVASEEHPPSEQTPLLSRDEENPGDASTLEADGPKRSSRLPSIIALVGLCIAAVVVLVAGFAAPATVEEYAKEAVTFDPQRVSIESFTNTGVRARIQGDLYFDASKVSRKSVRDFGKAATWIASKVESGDAEVQVFLPGYDDILLGTARVPPVVLSIRNQDVNRIDIVADLEPGNIGGLRQVAQDFLHGDLKMLDVQAVARVSVKSGLISLGTQTVTQNLKFKHDDVPKVPKFDIEKLKVTEFGQPGHPEGIQAKAQVSALNHYPVTFDVPPVAFEVLLPDCADSYLVLGSALTDVIHVLPKQKVSANVAGLMRRLPTSLTTACPSSGKSPLDSFVGNYLRGTDATIYIRGGEQKDKRTPRWIGQLLEDTVIPVPLPNKPFENMIKNFSLTNVNFKMPETAELKPRLSATVKVVVGLPKDINFDVDVNRVRADADMYYKGQLLGKLDLRKWQASKSQKHGAELWVQSEVVDAPLDVTDADLFSEVIQAMIWGHKGVEMGVKAKVDVHTTTALGEFTVRQIPGDSKIWIKPFGGGKGDGSDGKLKYTIKDIAVTDSTPQEMILETKVVAINPTEYSASIPYTNVSVWANGTNLGHAWGSFDIKPGKNDLVAYASWFTGPVGAELLSQYISGRNVSFTIRTHSGSLPGLPDPQLSIDVPLPHVFGKFLKETTMHIFSSTATFVLHSPLRMLITDIAASAFYNGTKIGNIDYGLPFGVIVGDTLTPRLPVDWNTAGGFGLIRDALGGSLKLDARADVKVKLGQWEERLWYEAKGLGAKVRP